MLHKPLRKPPQGGQPIGSEAMLQRALQGVQSLREQARDYRERKQRLLAPPADESDAAAGPPP
jgi:hypothetical protein